MEIRDWECDVVYDLLPLYMDGKAGEDSRTFVKEHLQKCRSCRFNIMTPMPPAI